MKINAYFANLEAKNLFKVCRLTNEKQIKGPASAKIGHNDCIDWHGGEKLSPWGLKFLWKHLIDSERCLDMTVKEIKRCRPGTHF